jgi:hypothetical protein
MDNRYTALEWAAMEGGQEVTPMPTAKLPFLQELAEARMYKNRDTLQGKTAEELAKGMFLMIMMLEILRKEDSSFAKRYSINTQWNQDFRSLRLQASDLHNIITVLSNQDQFADKIAVNKAISPPILQLKHYFRDIENDRKDRGWDRAFFKKLEEFLKINDSACREVRRAVADWHMNSDNEKHTVRYQIKNLLLPTNQQNDLLLHFKNKLQG